MRLPSLLIKLKIVQIKCSIIDYWLKFFKIFRASENLRKVSIVWNSEEDLLDELVLFRIELPNFRFTVLPNGLGIEAERLRAFFRADAADDDRAFDACVFRDLADRGFERLADDIDARLLVFIVANRLDGESSAEEGGAAVADRRSGCGCRAVRGRECVLSTGQPGCRAGASDARPEQVAQAAMECS